MEGRRKPKRKKGKGGEKRTRNSEGRKIGEKSIEIACTN